MMILVIDDDQMNLKIMQKLLNKLNYSVDLASNGQKGIELFKHRSSEYLCVIIDYTLPDLSCEETIHQLRVIDSDIKIILASGYSMDYLQEQLNKVKITHFLQKPFSFKELQEVLQTITT
jgi:CheY-like chemotaxis protein